MSVGKSCPRIFVSIPPFENRQADKVEESRLGIMVNPSKVHLIPNANDAYTWKVLPGKEKDFKRLFSKNLSDHGPSAHKELSQGVGMIFEAVFAENYAENVPDAITSVREETICTIATNDKQLRPEISFTAKIG